MGFDIEAAEKFFRQPVAFERGASGLEHLPAADRPEVAFAGRSNVGKSSLMNALFGRKNLVRASSEPGRTRELNFFMLGEAMRLVDLPGYGYAKAPKADIARWTELMRDYLRGRPGLKRVFLLIDSRHGPKPNDIEIMDALDGAAQSYQIVLTKADKPEDASLAAAREAALAAIKRRPAAHPDVLVVSAHSGLGLDLLRAEIAALA
ncbi:MAG TPA: ribosome biogenesis GTP-binding protein YihA/YsxC [Caulobacterales bacterium]|nr:ribosome biogenesis GTP-binding protein YihA/YsxC [Caulobacterales bacterium]